MRSAAGIPQHEPSSRPVEIPALNGIRTLAVTLVFFAHSGLERIVPGGLGVTIFFVLSGYLITTLMRCEFADNGSLRLRAFYLRRILRLMPPLFIVVAVAALLSLAGVIDGSFSPAGLLSVLFYLGNYFVITHDFSGIPAGMGVVWSLAVEEHYYLLFPPLAILLLRDSRRGLSATVLIGLCAAIFVWRCWLAQHGASEAYLTMASDTRADAILIGCLMALLRNPVLDLPPRNLIAATNLRRNGIVGTGCVALLLMTLTYRNDFFRLTARYTLQSLAIAPLIYIAIVHSARWPFRWLNTKPMEYLGTVSYTIYLSHQLILDGVLQHWPQLPWSISIAVTAVLTLLIAEAMRRWIEQPFAILRRQLHHRLRSLQAKPRAVAVIAQ